MALLGPALKTAARVMSTFSVSVHSIGSGGFGIGTLPEGKVVFVPRTAPGDQVEVRVVKEKARWARGEAIEWMKKGSGRQPPPCPRFNECDGCSLQHLSYPEQLFWKGRTVGEALRRLGGLEWRDPEVEPSPEELHYRNKITFTLRRLPGGRLVAGFRELGHRGRVLDVGDECLLPGEDLTRVWGEIRSSWGPAASFLPEGRELRLTLRSGEEGSGLLIQGGRGDGQPAALLSSVPGLTSIWRREREGTVRHLAGDEAIRVSWGGENLELPGGGFVQTNPGAWRSLLEYVLGECGEVQGEKVIDAFCGVGAMGRAVASRGGLVTGIETDPAAALVSERNPVDGFQVVTGRVEKELRFLLPASLVILNPPRTGLSESVPTLLAKHRPDRILYVSCDPATLARDLKRFGSSFQVTKIRSFDLFPQTSHVETVVTLAGLSSDGEENG